MPRIRLINRFRAHVTEALSADDAGSRAAVALSSTAGLPADGATFLIVSTPVPGRAPVVKETLSDWSSMSATTLLNAHRATGVALAVGDVVECALTAEAWESLDDDYAPRDAGYDFVCRSTDDIISAFTADNVGKSVKVVAGVYTIPAATTLIIPSGMRVDIDGSTLNLGEGAAVRTTEDYTPTVGAAAMGRVNLGSSLGNGGSPATRVVLTSGGFWQATAWPAMSAGELATGQWTVVIDGVPHTVASRDSDTQITLAAAPARVPPDTAPVSLWLALRKPVSNVVLRGRLHLVPADEPYRTDPVFALGGMNIDTSGLSLTAEWRTAQTASGSMVKLRVVNSRIGPVRVRGLATTASLGSQVSPTAIDVRGSHMSSFAACEVLDQLWTVSGSGGIFSYPVDAAACHHSRLDIAVCGVGVRGSATVKTLRPARISYQAYCLNRLTVTQTDPDGSPINEATSQTSCNNIIQTD